MPIDPEPHDSGNLVLRAQAHDEVELVLAVPPAAFPDEPRYLSHFATCPDAKEWRR
jgi:hypothetical protein